MWCQQLCLKKKKKGSQSWAKPTKPASLWPSLRNKTSRFWSIPPTAPTWLQITFGCSPSPKKSWLGRNFPAFRTQDLAKAVNLELYESMHCLNPTIKMPLNLGADDWNCVCEMEKSALKECECCSYLQSDHWFLIYWPADSTKWTILVLTAQRISRTSSAQPFNGEYWRVALIKFHNVWQTRKLCILCSLGWTSFQLMK